MKAKLHTFLLAIACFCLSKLVWSQESVKGNWTTQDKFTAIAELNQQRAVFEAFLDSSQVDPLIQCIADELEQSFDNPKSIDTRSDTIQAISLHCLEAVGFKTTQEVNSSTRGNWSEKDLVMARESLEITRGTMLELMEPDNVDILFECVLAKLESNYNNFDEALNDPNGGISNLTLDCISEKNILGEGDLPSESSMINKEEGDPNSQIGNWSEQDKAALEEQLNELRPKFEAQLGKENTERVFECVRFNFENTFTNYAEVNNHPEIYKAILDECYGKGK